MKLLLDRESLTDKSTGGSLYVVEPAEERFECYTLEDKVREIPGKSVSEWKIKGKTAIPIGTYKVILAPSPKRGGKLMPLLLKVPGFVGVQIHVGNTDEDTEGCILLGSWRENADTIRGSKIAFEKFFAKLLIADAAREEVWIEIRNPK
jgi:hypothetical protein